MTTSDDSSKRYFEKKVVKMRLRTVGSVSGGSALGISREYRVAGSK